MYNLICNYLIAIIQGLPALIFLRLTMDFARNNIFGNGG